jgi:hypothetical protein
LRLTLVRLLPYIAFVLLWSTTGESVAYAAVDAALTPAAAKQMLAARGVGKMTKVKQTDGKVLRARIISIGESSVVLQDGSKPSVEVPYDHLSAVMEPGLSKGKKIAIGVVLVVIILGALLASAGNGMSGAI